MATHSQLFPGPEQFPVPDVIKEYPWRALNQVLSEKTFSVINLPLI
jgi:hypothetical protein